MELINALHSTNASSELKTVNLTKRPSTEYVPYEYEIIKGANE